MEGDSLVMEFVVSGIEERDCALLLFNFFELLDERGVRSQFCTVALLKFGPTLGIVTEPFSKFVRRCDLFQPEIEMRLFF